MSFTTTGSVRVVWVWPEMMTSMPSTAFASSSSSESLGSSLVPEWDRQMIRSAPCSLKDATHRSAASAASSSAKPEVGAQSSESTPIRPKMP